MNVVEIEGVSQRYGRATVLHDLNLSLAPGEVLGLFGHNGAGQDHGDETGARPAARSAGEVRVFGRAPSDPHVRRWLGYLPENVTFYAQLSGVETLRHFARLKGAPMHQVDSLLDDVGLTAAAGRRVKTYSKGMRQRLGLAQALLGEPRCCCSTNPPWASTRSLPRTCIAARPPACGRHQHHPVLPRAAGRRGAHQPCGDPDPGPPAGLGQPGAVARRGRLADADPHLRLAARRIAATTLERRRPCHPALGRRRAASGGAQRQQGATAAPLLAEDSPSDVEILPPSLEDIYRHYMDSAMVTAQEAAL
ncbi:hypothetical protein BZ164_03325 [Pseudomonas veronii]|nr:hypothetical protein BZ164_03325 [Pseudomonas veronii]